MKLGLTDQLQFKIIYKNENKIIKIGHRLYDLALNWSHQDLVAMMYDLICTLVLEGAEC